MKHCVVSRGAPPLDNTVEDAVTHKAYHMGKSRKPNLDMRGIAMEKRRCTAGEFSPAFPEVGNARSQGEVDHVGQAPYNV